MRWRGALTEIARFCGWDVPNHRSESKLVRIIVDKLSHYLKCSSSNLAGNRLVPFAVKPIDFYSYEGFDNIGIVRICGMDGMGRTTVARVVYDAVVNEKLGNERFRQVVSEMPKECIRYIWDTDAVINTIRKKMVHKKVLLLVDHVDTLEQVASLLMKHAYGWVVPKSRIIVSASTPNKTILNVLDISFQVPEATEHNISLDIACFVTEMDDSHVTRIIRSLVSTNLCTNSGIKVLINKSLINISDYDKPLNIAESTSLDMLLDMGCTGESIKSSQHRKTRKRSKHRRVYKISVNSKIQKHNRVKSSIKASQEEALLSFTSRGKFEADRLQSVHKFVKDAKSDVATESIGVNIEKNPILDMAEKILLPNALATVCDDSISGGTLVLRSSDNETNECDSAFAHNVSSKQSVSGMLFSSKAGDRKLQYFMPEVLNGKKIVRIPEAVLRKGLNSGSYV
ncbi:Disease resistance protein (TIR-NBS-LRR class) family [Euphorbia peplus]|nr:Disease resistance protein (TIR-NBS-LRR class) family [Euphorbia peplus]